MYSRLGDAFGLAPSGATATGGGTPAPYTGGDWPADVAVPGGWGSSVDRPYRPGESVGVPIGVKSNGELAYGYSYGSRVGDLSYKNPLTNDYTTWARPPGYSGPDIPLVASAGASPPSSAAAAAGSPSAMLSPAAQAAFIGGVSTPPDVQTPYTPPPGVSVILAPVPLPPQPGAPTGGTVSITPPVEVGPAPVAAGLSSKTLLIVGGAVVGLLGLLFLSRRRS